MSLGDAVAALLLGVVEGLTEFIPISSTGHLIVVADALGRNDPGTDTFIVVIQLGAILAVCWHFRAKLLGMLFSLHERQTMEFVGKLFVAFLPAALVGLAFHAQIKEHLFSPLTVAFALVAGGIAILVIEKMVTKTGIEKMEDIGWNKALLVGVAQVLSLFPGVSRSAATIMGARIFGLSRPAATEFSFFLAIPVMFAAASFDLYQGWGKLQAGQVAFIAVGFVAAFLSALVAVRWLLAFVQTHDFKPFGWYRIAFGLLVAIYALA